MDDRIFLQTLRDQTATQYMAVGAMTLIVYDHLICLEEEIGLMWKGRWSAAKIAYFWNRYFALYTIGFNTAIRTRWMDTDIECNIFLQILNANAAIIIGTVDFVLMLRVWVLYDRSRLLLYIMIPLLIGEIIAILLIGGFTVSSLAPYVHEWPMSGCMTMVIPSYFGTFSIPPMVITLFMFFLTLYKCGRTLLAYEGMNLPAFRMLLQDGILWFIAVFMAGTPQILLCYVARPTLTELMIGPSLSIYSIIASRGLLHIKKMLNRSSTQGSIYLQSIRFRHVDDSALEP